MPYVFPGIQHYITAAALELGVPPVDVGPARQLYHVSRIQDALGQLPTVADEARPAVLDHVAKLRDGLAAALAGVDRAIADAADGVGLGVPVGWYADSKLLDAALADVDAARATAAQAVEEAIRLRSEVDRLTVEVDEYRNHLEGVNEHPPVPDPTQEPAPDEPAADDPPA